MDVSVRHDASAVPQPRPTFLFTFQQVLRVSCDTCVSENVAAVANCAVSRRLERPKAICPCMACQTRVLLSPCSVLAAPFEHVC